MIKAIARITTPVLLLGAVALTAGCETDNSTQTTKSAQAKPAATMPSPTGFLSNYHTLQPSGPSKMLYLEPTNRLATYTKFWIRPVVLMDYSGGELDQLTFEQKQRLSDYMYNALVKAVRDAGYAPVGNASTEAAEVRVAITDVRRARVPAGGGVSFGSLSMEGEILDATSNVQIAAVIDSQVEQATEWSELDKAKAVMDDWADGLREAIDIAHGKAPDTRR